jgi:hypothetical protein
MDFFTVSHLARAGAEAVAALTPIRPFKGEGSFVDLCELIGAFE